MNIWADQLTRADETGAGWFLISPVVFEGFVWSGHLVDGEVHHGVGDWPMTDSDRPNIAALEKIRPVDGETFAERTLSIDVFALAAEIVINSVGNVQVRRPKGSGYSNGGPEAWRQAARAARVASAGFRRARWTPELNKRVVETWQHIHYHGCGTLAELADDLGTTPNQLSAHLSKLRKRWGSERVPWGNPGRRSHRLSADR